MSGLVTMKTSLQNLKISDDGELERVPIQFRCGECGKEWTQPVQPWLIRYYEPGVNTDACDECAAKGLDPVKVRLAKEAHEAREKRATEIIARSCGKKYATASFQTFVPKTESQVKAFQACEDFVGDLEGSLYLYGGTGCGKTHLAAAVYRHVLFDHGHEGVSFWPMPELLMHIRREMTSDGGCEDEAIRRLIEVPLLILDDLGTEKLSDWARQTLYTIIAGRDRNGRPTMYTSNLTLAQIGDHIGDRRVTSRIAGSARIIHVQGEDHRIASRRRK